MPEVGLGILYNLCLGSIVLYSGTLEFSVYVEGFDLEGLRDMEVS